MDPNDGNVPDLTAPPDLMNQLNPGNMAMNLMPGQSFMPNNNLGGMPMGDPSMMMPILLANGNLPSLSVQPESISAGQLSSLLIMRDGAHMPFR